MNLRCLFFSLIMLLLALSCTDVDSTQKKQKIVDSVTKPVSKQVVMYDTLTIPIVSPSGKLLREHSYVQEIGNADRYFDYNNSIKGYSADTVIRGDFDGNGKHERAWFSIRRTEDEDSMSVFTGIIRFSDKGIKPLVIEDCTDILFKNEGDLYGNGQDVIGVLPGWNSSACRAYMLYVLKNGKWTLACSPIGSTLNMREAGIVVIENTPLKKAVFWCGNP